MSETAMLRLDLYGTAGCHLCEEAEHLLRTTLADIAGPVEWRPIDIAEDAGLMARYGVRIPVLACRDSDAELGWPFDAERLRSFLRALTAL